MGVVFWHRELKMLAYRSCESYWCLERIISRNLCFCEFCHSWNEARVKLQLQCVVSKLIMVELTHSLWWSLWVTCYGIDDWVCNLLREKPCVFVLFRGEITIEVHTLCIPILVWSSGAHRLLAQASFVYEMVCTRSILIFIYLYRNLRKLNGKVVWKRARQHWNWRRTLIKPCLTCTKWLTPTMILR